MYFSIVMNKEILLINFPINPNGSINNIAAISNKAGNVMAMMPHPERTINGDAIFHSMRDYIAEGRIEQTVPLYYYPRRQSIPAYPKYLSIMNVLWN